MYSMMGNYNINNTMHFMTSQSEQHPIPPPVPIRHVPYLKTARISRVVMNVLESLNPKDQNL